MSCRRLDVTIKANNDSPASILIAYTSVGLIVYVVMTALGEMAAWIPHSSGFAGYATRFCDPALGFALGWTYWCKVRGILYISVTFL